MILLRLELLTVTIVVVLQLLLLLVFFLLEGVLGNLHHTRAILICVVLLRVLRQEWTTAS